jgi:hypothetical protein
MRLINRLSVAAALGVIATVAACSDSTTGPPGGGPKAGTLAQHFDTLYAQAKASSTSDTNFTFRAALLSDIELAAAFGATPTNLTVTTSAGTEQWKGFVFEEVSTDTGVASDSVLFVVAYRDSLAHTILVAGFQGNGSLFIKTLLTNDTLQLVSNSGSGSATLTSVGSGCATPIAGLVNPIIVSAESTTCTSAVFGAALTLGFPAATGVDPALTSLSFPTTSFAGERFFDASSAGSRVRIVPLFDRLRTSH